MVNPKERSNTTIEKLLVNVNTIVGEETENITIEKFSLF